jgi:hypothetical protein
VEEIMRIFILFLLLITDSAYAEVYKCQSANKKIQYQSEPCATNTINHGIVKIEKQDERQQEEAQNRLKALEKEQQTLDEAAKKQRETNNLEAIRREAAAARQEAAAAKREAEAARQQATYPYPLVVPYPGYGIGNYYPNNNLGHNHHHQGPVYTPGLSGNPMFSPNPNPSFSPSPFSPFPPPMPARPAR